MWLHLHACAPLYAPTWKYMIRIFKRKYVVKTISSDSRQWQAVSCSENWEECENISELPNTHMSAALETLQEILICTRFMYVAPQSYYVRFMQTVAVWRSTTWIHKECCAAFKHCRKYCHHMLASVTPIQQVDTSGQERRGWRWWKY